MAKGALTRPRTWLTRVDELAAEHPDTVALLTTGADGEALTWRDLAWRSAGIARLFAERDVGQGTVVALQLPNSAAFVLAALAAWRLGATVLPLRWDLPNAECARLLAMAKPVIRITLMGGGTNELSAAELGCALLADPAGLPPPPVAAPAWITASGGSTGSPKLIAPNIDTVIATSHGMRFTEAQSHFANNAEHRHPVHLVCTPLYHTHGFVLLFRTLVEDFRVILMPRFEIEEFLDLIECEKVGFFSLVPTIAVRLLKSPSIRNRNFSSVENVILGAGATPDWAVRELIELIGSEKVRIGYGMSESLAASFIRGDEWLQHPGSVGKPIGVETRVVDDEGRPLPAGEVGELYFRPLSGQPTFNYIGDTELRSLPGGWASVGDLGRLDHDGYLYIVDRRPDMIKTGGANVFVSEVEAALLAHPAVADAAVVGLPDAEWGRRVHAIIQPFPGVPTADLGSALREHCKLSIAAYKAPRSFDFVTDLGRTEAGKLNRQALARAREREIL
jgi:bile acid-coenzyme A ligase